MKDLKAPDWASLLTDDDEWVVRTALANVASDLERIGHELNENTNTTLDAAMRESAQRYRDVLARIEEADDE